MKGISVDPVILYLKKICSSEDHRVSVVKAERTLKSVEGDEVFRGIDDGTNMHFRSFGLLQHNLTSSGWVLCPEEELEIIRKVESGQVTALSTFCSSFQGIISGCDRAFIVDDFIIEKCKIEKDITRKWIKNSCIKNYFVGTSSLSIIYSDLIRDTDKYKNALRYISEYRDRLENRRECRSGVRKWYELQWGRDSSLFEMKKIVFPYKASCSRFALDEGSYSSADVYGMVIRDEYRNRISYEFLLGLLNSKLYEFYFKSYGKKLGDGLYDYYPNTVMRLMIPWSEDQYISRRVRAILEYGDALGVQALRDELDRYVYRMFKLTEREIEIIEERIEKQ